MADSVVDKLTYQQGHLVRERSYPERNAVLAENLEMQKSDSVRPTDGLRPFARFPEHELQRLSDKAKRDKNTPSYYADLTAPDGKIRTRAITKLVNSSEGHEYRVGKTNRKSFSFKVNPLAKG
jgi:hypothetical protein